MTLDERLIRTRHSLLSLDQSIPTIVTFDSSSGILEYSQVSRVVRLYQISDIVLTKDVKLGLLTPYALQDLIDSITDVLESNILNKEVLLASPTEFGLSFYHENSREGAQVVFNLSLLSTTSWLYIHLYMNLNPRTKKLFKNYKESLKASKDEVN